MRPRLAVATTFPVHPRLGGGQVRIHDLYRHLAQWFEVEVVSLTSADDPRRRLALAPGLRETVIPKTDEHADAERTLAREVGHVVTDVAMTELYTLTPDYLSALHAACDGAEAVVASHPYTHGAIREVSEQPLWYEAHNVEATLKHELLGPGPLLDSVTQVERACCAEAEWIWTCSEEDRSELVRRYGADRERILLVPNGVELDGFPYASSQERRALRAGLTRPDRRLAVFIASWHPPNIEGARSLLAAADRAPGIDFLVMGSVGLALTSEPVPSNVQLTGPVSAGFKQDALRIADFAVNTVTSGSGTNLKMLDYFASGVPVVSTSFGARGLGAEDGVHFTGAEPWMLPVVLRRLARSEHDAELEAQARAARALVERDFSWEVIARRLADALGVERQSASVHYVG